MKIQLTTIKGEVLHALVELGHKEDIVKHWVERLQADDVEGYAPARENYTAKVVCQLIAEYDGAVFDLHPRVKYVWVFDLHLVSSMYG